MLPCCCKNVTPVPGMGELTSIVLNGLSKCKLDNNRGIISPTGDESPYYERAFVVAQFIARLEHG